MCCPGIGFEFLSRYSGPVEEGFDDAGEFKEENPDKYDVEKVGEVGEGEGETDICLLTQSAT